MSHHSASKARRQPQVWWWATLFYLKWHNKVPVKEAIKVLFMYIMIHKLDLYINIAFHPNNDQNIILSIKMKTSLKRDFPKREEVPVLLTTLQLWKKWMNCKIWNYYKSIKYFSDALKQASTPELFINAIKYFGWNAFLVYLSLTAHKLCINNTGGRNQQSSIVLYITDASRTLTCV